MIDFVLKSLQFVQYMYRSMKVLITLTIPVLVCITHQPVPISRDNYIIQSFIYSTYCTGNDISFNHSMLLLEVLHTCQILYNWTVEIKTQQWEWEQNIVHLKIIKLKTRGTVFQFILFVPCSLLYIQSKLAAEKMPYLTPRIETSCTSHGAHTHFSTTKGLPFQHPQEQEGFQLQWTTTPHPQHLCKENNSKSYNYFLLYIHDK